jgi:hypothetical protein
MFPEEEKERGEEKCEEKDKDRKITFSEASAKQLRTANIRLTSVRLSFHTEQLEPPPDGFS